MCLICDHLNKDKLTISEAWRNLSEIYDDIGDDHAQEVLDLLWEKAMNKEDGIDSVTWGHIFQGILI